MRRPRCIRADQLLRQLESDPEHIAREREWKQYEEEAVREFDRDQAHLISELQRAGLRVESVEEYVARGGAPLDAIPVLVSHLDRPHISRVWETIVRALSVRHAHDLALPRLSELYTREKDPSRRWLLANAIGSMAKLREVRHLPDIERYRALFRQSYKPPHQPPPAVARRRKEARPWKGPPFP